MTERWAPIPDFEGRYEVSDQGRVRSLPKDILTAAGYRRVKGRLLSPYPTGTGKYWHIDLHRDRQPRVRAKIHLLVLRAFRGERPEGMYGLHNDGDKNNNALSNLRWDTPSANQYDRVAHGGHHGVNKTHLQTRARVHARKHLLHESRTNLALLSQVCTRSTCGMA